MLEIVAHIYNECYTISCPKELRSPMYNWTRVLTGDSKYML